MNRVVARLLTRLYPRRWRNRYGAEFEAFLLKIAQYSDTKTSSVISSAARLSARGQLCAVEKPASRLRPKAGSSTAFRHPTSGWRNSARNDMVWGMSLDSATLRSSQHSCGDS